MRRAAEYRAVSGGSKPATAARPQQPSRNPRLCVTARRTLREDKLKRERNELRAKFVKPAAKQETSWLADVVRNTPVLDRLTDGMLMFGDLVMIVATEASSERIALECLPILTGVTAGTWVVSAIVLGDYKGGMPESKNWYLNLLGPSFTAIVDTTVTWGLAVLLAMAVFSVLVSTNVLPAGPLFDDLASEDMSPQLEVAAASLVTMCCWRGIAARLRY